MKFRPEHDPHPGSPVEWADNWLSNTMAYVSVTLVPNWCRTPDHWTSRAAQYLFTDCPCCMLFRGITVGIWVGFPLGALFAAAALSFK